MTRALVFLCCGLVFVSLGLLLPEPKQEAHLAKIVRIGVAGNAAPAVQPALIRGRSVFIPPTTKMASAATEGSRYSLEPKKNELERNPLPLPRLSYRGDDAEQAAARNRAHEQLQKRILAASTGTSLEPAKDRAKTDVTVGVSAPAPVVKERVAATSTIAAPRLSRADRYRVARSLQKQLRVAGCYSGLIDGIWGPASKRAMSAFNAKINSRLDVAQPRELLLTIVRSRPGIVCGDNVPIQNVQIATADASNKTSPKLIGGRIIPRLFKPRSHPTVTAAVVAPKVVAKTNPVHAKTVKAPATKVASVKLPKPVAARPAKAVARVKLKPNRRDLVAASSVEPPAAAKPETSGATRVALAEAAAAAKRKARSRRIRARRAKARRIAGRRTRARTARRRAVRRSNSYRPYYGRPTYAFQAPRRRYYSRSRGGGIYSSQPKWVRDAFNNN